MHYIISDFIVFLGKFLMHLCLAQEWTGVKENVLITIDFQVTPSTSVKKKKGMGSCFCLNQNTK
jgi:hypothetical protein